MTFDPAKHLIIKWCTGRKWHIPMASNRKKSRRWIWRTKWDKVKDHDTLIDWCTGREWLLNCMTVISAFIMTIKHAIPKIEWAIEWAIELLYNSKSASWGPEKSETRCGRESHRPAEGALGAPNWVGDQTS